LLDQRAPESTAGAKAASNAMEPPIAKAPYRTLSGGAQVRVIVCNLLLLTWVDLFALLYQSVSVKVCLSFGAATPLALQIKSTVEFSNEPEVP
jgi:hypothetical protein